MNKLPAGYTELEYIQSTGTQWIDTEFKPNNNTRVVMDSEFMKTPSGNTALFGARTAANSKNYAMLFIPPNFRADYNSTYTQTWSVSAEIRRIYDKNKETTTIDGEAKSYSNAKFQADYNLALLAINAAGAIQWFASMRLFSCEIYDNGTLIRSFIPCKNAAGAVGLYDLIGQKFYGNAGTGSFTAGPEIIPNPPDTPTQLQNVIAVALQWNASVGAETYNVYRDGAKIGSTGGTQYVDLTAGENETYTYTVTAENGDGESAGVFVTVYTKSGYFQYKPLIENANFP